MINIDFPDPQFRTRDSAGRKQIFDQLRKLWLPLTQEEWVRQNFIQYLVRSLEYPSALIAQEKEIRLHELKKRFDILVYDNKHQPWMLIECKAPQVELNEAVLQQVLRYNISVPVKYITITNGYSTYCWQKGQGVLESLDSLPAFQP